MTTVTSLKDDFGFLSTVAGLKFGSFRRILKLHRIKIFIL